MKTDSSAPLPQAPQSVDTLDALTGGVFTAPTSGERAARVRDWLATQPAFDMLNEVHRELAQRDKGAARLLKDRVDELRRLRAQDGLVADWSARAEALLSAERFNVADAMAWLRDAAKAGAPLSREPLNALKATLSDRIRAIDDLQHRVQVAKEAAVLLAQRIEVLSTKPLADALAVREALGADVARWTEDAQALAADAQYAHLDPKYTGMRSTALAQLRVVWEAFDAALQQAQAALADAAAPCPAVPVWADDIRRSRGEPVAADAPPAGAGGADTAARREAAEQIVQAAVAQLAAAVPQAPAKALQRQAADLRVLLKAHGRWIDPERLAQAQALVAQVADQQGAQRAQADLARQDLIARAEALTQDDPATGQRLSGRKLQDALKTLREQWKQVDRSGAPAHQGLWKRFDEACTQAHREVEVWLTTLKAESAANRAERLALIESVQAWTAAHAEDTRWREQARALHAFADAWRSAGHLGEKSFAELQPRWKAALDAARAPLLAAQAANRREREALIQQAQALSAEPALRLDAVRALQHAWQALAQAVPLDRKAEQALWDAFRGPIDAAFQRKDEARAQQASATSALDQQVLDAARALDEAVHSRDAQRIHAALAALDRAAAGDATTAQVAQVAHAGAPVDGPAAEDSVAASAEASVDGASAPAAAVAAPRAPARPVVAVRGDDRPGAKAALAAPSARPGRPGEPQRRGTADRPGRDGPRGVPAGAATRPGGGADRPGRGAAPVRLGDAAFRARRDASERAQQALRQLAAQAHGAALTQVLAAWEQRQSAQLPSLAELRGRVGAGLRQAWAAALDAPAAGDGAECLLRLEVAAEVPTPAPWTDQRRALQLLLLTRRNDPAPAQTWAQDVARLLATPWSAAHAPRLQAVLKALLKA